MVCRRLLQTVSPLQVGKYLTKLGFDSQYEVHELLSLEPWALQKLGLSLGLYRAHASCGAAEDDSSSDQGRLFALPSRSDFGLQCRSAWSVQLFAVVASGKELAAAEETERLAVSQPDLGSWGYWIA